MEIGERDREIQAKIIQIDSQITLVLASKLMKDVEIEIGMEIAIDAWLIFFFSVGCRYFCYSVVTVVTCFVAFIGKRI